MQKDLAPKIFVALLQVDANPWKTIFETGQLQTWIQSKPDNVTIVNIYGKKPNKLVRAFDLFHEKLRWSPSLQGLIHLTDKILNRILRKIKNPKYFISIKNGIFNFHVKTFSMHLTLPIVELAFFKYFLENTNATFLYMSNTSSYLNLNNLNNLLQKTKTSTIYGGNFHIFNEINFASGANRILSRDVVEILVKNFKDWDYSYVEDVAMGKLLQNESLLNLDIPSKNFLTISEIDNEPVESIFSTIHFRLKSGNLRSRIDPVLMKHLHQKITNKAI